MPFEKRVYLLRHGQNDRPKTVPEPAGTGLTSLGREQAARAGKRLSELSFNSIRHSTLKRAEETAHIISGFMPGVSVLPSGVLTECIPWLPDQLRVWLAAPPGRKGPFPTELEGWKIWDAKDDPSEILDGQPQAEQAWDSLFRPAPDTNRRELVISHGNLIRFFACRALGLQPMGWKTIDVNNCGLCEILVRANGKVELISYNDTGHLPYSMRTYI